jgi:hypothetical protein
MLVINNYIDNLRDNDDNNLPLVSTEESVVEVDAPNVRDVPLTSSSFRAS